MAQQDVSGFGSVINLTASETFPSGIQITNFAADSDPFDMSSIDIADKLVGVNGDFIVWAKANALPLSISVIPGSIADQNLQILADANRVAPGKSAVGDLINAAIIYPNGSATVFSNGRLMNAPFGKSVAGSGMQKTRTYVFAFENKTGA